MSEPASKDTAENIYREGFIDGLRAYAHWKDGKLYVGTCGTTLRGAVADVENTWNYSLIFRRGYEQDRD